MGVAGEQVARSAGEEARHGAREEDEEGPPRDHQLRHAHALAGHQRLRRHRKVLQRRRHAVAHGRQQGLHTEKRKNGVPRLGTEMRLAEGVNAELLQCNYRRLSQERTGRGTGTSGRLPLDPLRL